MSKKSNLEHSCNEHAEQILTYEDRSTFIDVRKII